MVCANDFCEQQMLAWIEDQVAFGPRHPGAPGGVRNEDYLLQTLERLGVRAPHKEPIPITCWEADQVELEVTGQGEAQVLESYPVPYCRLTSDQGVEAPLVHVDSGRVFPRAEVTGAIVVTEIHFPSLDAGLLTRLSLGIHDPDGSLSQVKHPATWVRLGWHIYTWAARRGAVGFVGILADQPGGSCRMHAPYGFKERDILDKPLPGVWVGREQGSRLRARLLRGRMRGRLRVTGRARPATTHNVVGVIPGESEQQIVLSCHHDSPFRSPVEDASGVSVVLALARHFARRPLHRSLVILLSAGHFYGSIGTRSYIEQHRDELARTAAEVSIEHIAREAVEDQRGRLVPTGKPEASGIFVPFNRAVDRAVLQAVRAHDLDRTVLLSAEGPLGEYPPTDGGDWHLTGVPTINCISNPVYLLTDDDAEQWVDRRRLVKMAATFAQVLLALDRIPMEELRRVDRGRFKLAMTLLRRLMVWKTTWLGLRPVY